MTSTARRLVLAALLVTPAVRAVPQPPNRAISLEGALAAPRAGPRPAASLAAGTWLDGELHATARLSVASAPRTDGRGAAEAAALVGLRWVADTGAWRPGLGVEAGLRLPVAGRRAAAGGALRVGLERLLSRQVAVSASAGVVWLGGEGAPEGALGITSYF